MTEIEYERRSRLAEDLLTMTLHGKPPLQTTMEIAEALVEANRRLAAYRVATKRN